MKGFGMWLKPADLPTPQYPVDVCDMFLYAARIMLAFNYVMFLFRILRMFSVPSNLRPKLVIIADMCYKDRPDMEKNLLDWEKVNAVDYMEKVNKEKRDTLDSRVAVAVEDR